MSRLAAVVRRFRSPSVPAPTPRACTDTPAPGEAGPLADSAPPAVVVARPPRSLTEEPLGYLYNGTVLKRVPGCWAALVFGQWCDLPRFSTGRLDEAYIQGAMRPVWVWEAPSPEAIPLAEECCSEARH